MVMATKTKKNNEKTKKCFKSTKTCFFASLLSRLCSLCFPTVVSHCLVEDFSPELSRVVDLPAERRQQLSSTLN